MIENIAEILLKDFHGSLTENERQELVEIQEHLREVVDETKTVYDRHPNYQNALGLLQQPGKQLRSFFVILFFRYLERVKEQTCITRRSITQIACAAELLHIFTLVHDDIIDQSTHRRGLPTAQAVVGPSIALILGDLLFCEALDILASSYDDRFSLSSKETTLLRIRQALECGILLSQGQILDIQSTQTTCLDLQTYLTTIQLKTVVFFEFLVRTVCIEDTENLPELLRVIQNLGRIFQITDDFIDVIRESERLHKDPGIDLQRGVKSFPILLLLSDETLTTTDRHRLHEIIDPACQETLTDRMQVIHDLFSKYHTFDKALEFVSELENNFEQNLFVIEREDRLVAGILRQLKRFFVIRIKDV